MMKTTTLLFICLLLTVGGQAQEAEKRPVWKVELADALNNYPLGKWSRPSLICLSPMQASLWGYFSATP